MHVGYIITSEIHRNIHHKAPLKKGDVVYHNIPRQIIYLKWCKLILIHKASLILFYDVLKVALDNSFLDLLFSFGLYLGEQPAVDVLRILQAHGGDVEVHEQWWKNMGPNRWAQLEIFVPSAGGWLGATWETPIWYSDTQGHEDAVVRQSSPSFP